MAFFESILLDQFEEDLKKDILQVGKERLYHNNDIIIDEGSEVDSLPFILGGSVKIYKPHDEAEILMYYLEPGDTCAISADCCMSGKKSVIKAVSDGESKILFVPKTKVNEWMATYPKWRSFILNNLKRRLDEAHDAIFDLTFNNLEERIEKYLHDRVLITKSDELNISHFDIANDLNSSRVVISRVLKKMEKAGQIELHRNRIKVLNY